MLILSNALTNVVDEGCVKVANSLVKRLKKADAVGTHPIGRQPIKPLRVANIPVLDGHDLGKQHTTVTVICVHHHTARHGEQSSLGGVVILHRTMQVEMLGRQVGKNGEIKAQRRYLAELQRMGGHLHNHRRARARSGGVDDSCQILI